MESHNKWSERITMLFLTMCVGYIFFIIPINLRDDSDGFTATCTVTKAYTQERRGTDLGGMTDIGLKGVFETEECGTLTMFEPPEGWKISAYVKTAQPRKKYLFHVSNRSNRKDRDFDMTRFEEIKE
ncbi:hypothetical protein [Rothia mucilaginosa]|jgi:hypothetical protein|uniref:hypothetical protein n=2 Tax=Micrococcaceae TaxID=1268 RepID=UPI0025DBF1CE|nr:hypothetical protein [Rothia mucilaginosa]